MFSRRIVNLTGFVLCAALLGYAYVLQFADGLEPCPLCIFQRIAFLALGLLFLAAGVHGPGRVGARVYGALIAIAGASGAGVAARHIWLQNLPPDQVPACGPGLDYMFDAFPVLDALKMAFTGSGECADISWSFLGLSIPSWALAWFVLLTVVGVTRNFAD